MTGSTYWIIKIDRLTEYQIYYDILKVSLVVAQDYRLPSENQTHYE